MCPTEIHFSDKCIVRFKTYFQLMDVKPAFRCQTAELTLKKLPRIKWGNKNTRGYVQTQFLI